MSMRARVGFIVVGVATLLVIVLGGTSTVFVHPTQHDVISIDDVVHTKRYFGTLDNYPHTYSFTVSEPTAVSLRILAPHTADAPQDKTGLLLELLPDDDGVKEVKRLPAKNASWEEEYAWMTGDSYGVGPTYFDSLEPGVYLFEVSTPINLGPYVLEVGTVTKRVGYITALKDMVAIKDFFGKSRIALLQSPLVLLPLIALAMLAFFIVQMVRIRLRARK